MTYGKDFEDLDRNEVVESFSEDEKAKRELKDIKEQPMRFSDSRGEVVTDDKERRENPAPTKEEVKEGVEPNPDRKLGSNSNASNKTTSGNRTGGRRAANSTSVNTNNK